MPADAGAPSISGAVPAPDSKFENVVNNLRDSLTCQICLKLLYEPFTTACGHTYCYECLVQWFRGNGAGLKKTCPDCRSRVSRQPAPAYLVRNMVETFCKSGVALPEGETMEEHIQIREEMATLIEQHKNDKGLFDGCFSVPDVPNAIHDAHDDVWRCPRCTTELEDSYCNTCDLSFDEDGAPVRNSSFYADDFSYNESEDDYGPDRLVDVEAETTYGGTTPYGQYGRPHPATHGPSYDSSHPAWGPAHDWNAYDDEDSDLSDSDDEGLDEDNISELIDDDDDDLDDSDMDSFFDDDDDAPITINDRSPAPLPHHQQSHFDDGTPRGSASSHTLQDNYARDNFGSPASFSSVEEDTDQEPDGFDGTNEARVYDTEDESRAQDTLRVWGNYGNQPVMVNVDYGEEDDSASGGYNAAGIGPSSDDESVQEVSSRKRTRHVVDDESSDLSGFDEPPRPLQRRRLANGRTEPVYSNRTGPRQMDSLVTEHSDSEEDARRNELPAATSSASSMPARTVNHNRPSNTQASHAPLRTVVDISSDDDDSDEEPVNAGRSRRREASLSISPAPHWNRSIPSHAQRKSRRDRDSATPVGRSGRRATGRT